MPHPFQIGSVVTLKSGGQPMTVTKISELGDCEIVVQWFEGTTLHHSAYAADALALAKDPHFQQ
jgi:uncharacterized protein YodC (DUF2158 family)